MSIRRRVLRVERSTVAIMVVAIEDSHDGAHSWAADLFATHRA